MFELVRDRPHLRRASPRLRARGSIGPRRSGLGFGLGLGLGASLALVGGCLREAEPCLIDLEPGDLVITEVRGPQDGADTRGEWFELYNATDDTLDLLGLRGFMVSFKGSVVDGELGVTFLVRESLEVEPGGRVVLGSLASPPPEVDYSFHDDFQVNASFDDTDGTIVVPAGQDSDPRALFSNARVQLLACDQVIDSVVYAQLPIEGTYSLDGALVPNAADNDDPARWCTDATPAPADAPQTELGLPGSPGEANRPCP